MIIFECSRPPRKLSVRRHGLMVRVMFAWFAVAYYPGGINRFMADVSAIGVQIHLEREARLSTKH